AFLMLVQATFAADACALLTKAEMSGFLGAQVVEMERADIGQGVASACHFLAGPPTEYPSAVLIVTELDGKHAMAQWCEGVDKFEGLGDQACVQTIEYATSVSVLKGTSAVRVILYYPPERIANPSSVARKATQKALERMQGLQSL